ncbi:MAG: hypothetical protein CMP26_14835 [Roseibacillus sp.]|nr:hypothetical protein [Roseibacillus sp.]
MKKAEAPVEVHVCVAGAGSPSEEGPLLLKKRRQRLRFGAAETEHRILLGDDLQNSVWKANPELVSTLSQEDVDPLDAFNSSEGDLEPRPPALAVSRVAVTSPLPLAVFPEQVLSCCFS